MAPGNSQVKVQPAVLCEDETQGCTSAWAQLQTPRLPCLSCLLQGRGLVFTLLVLPAPSSPLSWTPVGRQLPTES